MSALFFKMSKRGGYELTRHTTTGKPCIRSFLFNRDGNESCVHSMALTHADVAEIRAALDILELEIK